MVVLAIPSLGIKNNLIKGLTNILQSSLFLHLFDEFGSNLVSFGIIVHVGVHEVDSRLKPVPFVFLVCTGISYTLIYHFERT